VKDAEKTKKVGEEKRNEKDRDKQENEKGNIDSEISSILIYCQCSVCL
jgi:hypothetical protein